MKKDLGWSWPGHGRQSQLRKWIALSVELMFITRIESNDAPVNVSGMKSGCHEPSNWKHWERERERDWQTERQIKRANQLSGICWNKIKTKSTNDNKKRGREFFSGAWINTFASQTKTKWRTMGLIGWMIAPNVLLWSDAMCHDTGTESILESQEFFCFFSFREDLKKMNCLKPRNSLLPSSSSATPESIIHLIFYNANKRIFFLSLSLSLSFWLSFYLFSGVEIRRTRDFNSNGLFSLDPDSSPSSSSFPSYFDGWFFDKFLRLGRKEKKRRKKKEEIYWLKWEGRLASGGIHSFESLTSFDMQFIMTVHRTSKVLKRNIYIYMCVCVCVFFIYL